MDSHRVNVRGPSTAGRAGSGDRGRERDERRKIEWRRLLAELFGTFALTLVAAGGDVIESTTGHALGHVAKTVAPGLMVMATIYTVGEISGAHINPAVTLAFAIRRDFPWKRIPGYWGAQLLGAIGAAFFLKTLFGNTARLGATRLGPGLSAPVGFWMEVVLTVLLITVILGTAEQHRLVGPNAAIAVGSTVALDGLFAGPVSGASMNPARSLGPALVSGHLEQIWIYLLGPVAGALLAVILAWLLHGNPKRSEVKAAGGENPGDT
ncbi:aquaporin [Pannus brasiliensis CCIBt3594]|uniref:Aquaporin n=1 Tax=Pannus brasiliensis CCIBt3594 TaxID=1427578 RepID=A0AAW9QS95_9CHRO